MLVNRYIDLKYAYGFYEHFNEHCSCDLREGGQGLCNYGRYIDELISPEEFLQKYEDDFYDLKYGTFVRTDQDDIARIIGVEAESSKIFFILDICLLDCPFVSLPKKLNDLLVGHYSCCFGLKFHIAPPYLTV